MTFATGYLCPPFSHGEAGVVPASICLCVQFYKLINIHWIRYRQPLFKQFISITLRSHLCRSDPRDRVVCGTDSGDWRPDVGTGDVPRGSGNQLPTLSLYLPESDKSSPFSYGECKSPLTMINCIYKWTSGQTSDAEREGSQFGVRGLLYSPQTHSKWNNTIRGSVLFSIGTSPLNDSGLTLGRIMKEQDA